MPYVPSEKTPNPSGIIKDGKAQDRVLIDRGVLEVSKAIENNIVSNQDILKVYLKYFKEIGTVLLDSQKYNRIVTEGQGQPYLDSKPISYKSLQLAEIIYDVGLAYNYQGAFLGELNYAITRLIQEVPKRLVEQGKQKSELRYFLYAYTVEALVRASNYFNSRNEMVGIGSVFVDIKDEYKRRVNPAYEAAQIVKSGDCYDTPYLTKLVEVVDKTGKVVGHQEVMIKREDDNGKDIYGKMQIDLFENGGTE